MIIFSESSGFSRIFLEFFRIFDHMSLQNLCFTSQKLCDASLFQKIIRFLEFFRIFFKALDLRFLTYGVNLFRTLTRSRLDEVESNHKKIPNRNGIWGLEANSM